MAKINNGKVVITGIGTVTITASQPGNNDYLSAAHVGKTFLIERAALTIKADDKARPAGVSAYVLKRFIAET